MARRIDGTWATELGGEYDVDNPDLLNRVQMIRLMVLYVMQMKGHSGAGRESAPGMSWIMMERYPMDAPVRSMADPKGLLCEPTGPHRQGKSAMT